MPELRRLLLRILYTINSSGYILARSPTPVPVALINDEAPELQPYGTVSFKACLEAICRSSPELMQDRSKDYSVYVLDPLESSTAPAPLDISSSTSGRSTDAVSATEQSRAVAVGMGLMSRALAMEEKDPVTVVGTLGKQGSGQDAIEVIVALREIPTMAQARPPNPSHSWNISQTKTPTQTTLNMSNLPPSNNTLPRAETLATIASIQNRTKAKNKPKKLPRVSSTPVTESDKFLNADIYIGPVRKKGRPKGQANGESKVKPDNSGPATSQRSSPSLPTSTPDACIGQSTAAATRPNSGVNSATTQPPNCPPSNSPDLSALAALFSGSQNEAARNTLLLQVLSRIDTSNSQEEAQASVNPILVDALHQLLSNVFPQAQTGNTPTPATSPTPPLIATLIPPNTKEGALVDKENLSPTAFRRHSEGEHQHIKAIASGALSNGLNPEPVAQGRGLGTRSILNSPPKSVIVSTLLSCSSTNTRKRTLDDCMEERDNKRNRNQRTKGKDKERLDKKENPRFLSQQLSYENGFKHYPRLNPISSSRPEPGTISYYRQPLETWTSPPRPTKENVHPQSQMSDPLGGTSLNRPIVIPDSPQVSRVSASSPIKPNAAPKKPYIVPPWARTDTALKPRLSEEAQKAIEAAAERKKLERRANRRKINARAQDRNRQQENMTDPENLTPYLEPARPSQKTQKTMQPPPLPIIPNSDLPPIIASSDADPDLFPLTNPRAQSPPTRATILLPPVTPKRPSKVALSTPGADDFDQDSLFTPLSIARRSTGMGDSPLFSPDVLGSPLAHKKPRALSPISYRTAATQPDSESSTMTVKANEASEDNISKYKSPAIELDDAQEDLDCPPSSLPIASSDNEFEDATIGVTLNTSGQTPDNQTADDELNNDELPLSKQHWVGLPPSSPPPPTSPCLMPIDDDGDLEVGDVGEELPIASETDELEEEIGDEDMLNVTESDWSPSPADADDCTITLSTPTETSEPATSDQEDEMDEMAFLQQFTTLGSSDGLTDVQGSFQESQSISTDEINSLFASYGDNMDFEKFLEGFKPLITEGPSMPDHAPDFDFSTVEGLPSGEVTQSIDHHKMAADLQAILSGCVV